MQPQFDNKCVENFETNLSIYPKSNQN